MAKTDIVRVMVEPLVAAADADLYDVTFAGGKLVVAVTRPGGIDLESITEISRAINRLLDEEEPIQGAFTLEVTSPGLERTLRTAEHFAAAIDEDVTVRTLPDVEGERRIRGVLRQIEGDVVTIAVDDGTERSIAIDQIERARTVFTWETTPKSGGSKSGKQSSGGKQPSSQKKARS